jgi:hypothetical protein
MRSRRSRHLKVEVLFICVNKHHIASSCSLVATVNGCENRLPCFRVCLASSTLVIRESYKRDHHSDVSRTSRGSTMGARLGAWLRVPIMWQSYGEDTLDLTATQSNPS